MLFISILQLTLQGCARADLGQVSGVRGHMQGAGHSGVSSPRSRQHNVDADLVSSLEELGFFAIDVYEDGRWAAWCWKCTGEGHPPTACIRQSSGLDTSGQGLSFRPCTKLSSARAHVKSCHSRAAPPVPLKRRKRLLEDRVVADGTGEASTMRGPEPHDDLHLELSPVSPVLAPEPRVEADMPPQLQGAPPGALPELSSADLTESDLSDPEPEPQPAPPSTDSLSGESAVGAFEEESEPPPVAARRGSGLWFYQNRLSKIARGSSLSILQVAYNIAELREQGVPKIATDAVCKLVSNVLLSIGAGKKKPHDHGVPLLRDVSVAGSTHLMEKVLGVRDPTDFLFGWCQTCGLRFAHGTPVPSPRSPLQELLCESCPNCGTLKYKVSQLLCEGRRFGSTRWWNGCTMLAGRGRRYHCVCPPGVGFRHEVRAAVHV